MMNGKKKPMMGMDMSKGYKSGGKVPAKQTNNAPKIMSGTMKIKGYAGGGMVKPKGRGC
jgi:hypothetical protein